MTTLLTYKIKINTKPDNNIIVVSVLLLYLGSKYWETKHVNKKLAPYGRLLATDGPCQLQSHVTRKLGQISEIRPELI